MANRVLVWTPRGVAVIYILMMSLFALDVEDESLLRAARGFVIHLVPALGLLGCTVLASKQPHAGGIAFMPLGVVAGGLFFKQ